MIVENVLDLLFWVMVSTSIFTFLVSIPLYLLTIWTIARNLHKSPFDSQFFFIFIAIGITDIGCYLIHLVKRAAFLGILPNIFLGKNNSLTAIYHLLFAVVPLVQYQSLILITVNRFFAICLPIINSKYWHCRTSSVLILIIVIISSAIGIPVLIDGSEFRTTTIVGTFSDITKITGPWMLNATYAVKGLESFLIFFIFQTPIFSSNCSGKKHTQVFYNDYWGVLIYVLLAVCIFGYSAMFVKLWWLSRHGQMGTLAETEIRLGFAGLILFLLCLLVIAFAQAGIFVQRFYPELKDYHAWLMLALSDFSDTHSLWALLIVSGETRSALRQIIVGNKNSTPIVIQNKNIKQMHTIATAAPSNIVSATKQIVP